MFSEVWSKNSKQSEQHKDAKMKMENAINITDMVDKAAADGVVTMTKDPGTTIEKLAL